MGSLNEFSIVTRAFLKVYRWQQIDTIPFVKLNKTVDQCKIALVSSAGLVLPNQTPFSKKIIGGDSSHREIPNNIDVQKLIESHRSRSFDRTGMTADRNLVFPIDRINQLAENGVVSSVNHRHISVMGSIITPETLINESAPQIAQLLKDDGVNLTLLIPV